MAANVKPVIVPGAYVERWEAQNGSEVWLPVRVTRSDDSRVWYFDAKGRECWMALEDARTELLMVAK